MSDVSSLSGISGLSFDSTLLSPPLLTPIAVSVLSSFCQLTHSPDFFPENSFDEKYFSLINKLFCMTALV